MSKNNTQRERIEEYMLSGNSITQIEALEKFGCFRLASVIHRIRKKRFVYTTMITNKYGNQFAKYYVSDKDKYSDNNKPDNVNENKTMLLLVMKGYDKQEIQFKDTLGGQRQLKVGYWEPILSSDLDYIKTHSNIKLDEVSIWDDDCGRKYWYEIIN